MDRTDDELLASYFDGCIEDLEELVEKYRRPLFGFICGMTGAGGDPEEVFQEVWFRVIKKLTLYRSRNFLGWLMRIARNLVIDAARRKKPAVSLDAEQEDGRVLIEKIAGGNPGPVAGIKNAELGDRISRAMAELPVEQKEVFVMRSQSDLSFKEIARIQKVSINTALARMQYAVDKLRLILKSDYEEITGKQSGGGR